MIIKFFKRFTPILMVVSTILLSMVFCLMLTSNGIIHVKSAHSSVNADLIYDGEYIDLLTVEQQSAPLGSGEVRVTKIDAVTGYPAAAELALADENGSRLDQVDVVGFSYRGLPALLRFTNNVADGFVYQNAISELLKNGNLNTVWETDPGLLQQALADYTNQVSALIG